MLSEAFLLASIRTGQPAGRQAYFGFPHADMAELADALDSGSSDRKVVEVRLLLSALSYLLLPKTATQNTGMLSPVDCRDLTCQIATLWT